MSRLGTNVFLSSREIVLGDGVTVEIEFLGFGVTGGKMSGIIFNVSVEDLSKFIIASRKCHRDLALTKHCISGGEVGNLTSMEEMLLVFEGVSDKELCVTETLDVGMFDGAWVNLGSFFSEVTVGTGLL